MPSFQKCLAAFVGVYRLLFPGEFDTGVNITAHLLYNILPEGATICTALKEGANATAIL